MDVGDKGRYYLTAEQDLSNEVTTFKLRDCTLKVFGVQDIKSTHIHAETFLEIQFRIRGGSGVKQRRTILLCISNGNIYKSLDYLSEVTSSVNKVYNKLADSLKLFDEKENYFVNLSVSSTEEGNYKVVLDERRKVESKHDPTQNIHFEKAYELSFDRWGCFFYNSIEHINKYYKVYSARDKKTMDKFVGSDIPCVQLYENRYLYLRGEWCLDNGQYFLSCF